MAASNSSDPQGAPSAPDGARRSAGRVGPFAGLRVLDLTSVVLGPFATQTLGDMGADVIKVESPEGDIIRYAEPARSRGMGALFLNANRNKRSIVLDLKQPAAHAVVMRLAAASDVFIHSMRPQAIARLGLGYDAVAAVRSDIVYCSTWGFGSRGRYSEQPAYDDVIQGMSGLADLFQRRSGQAPEFAPTIMADKITGLTAYGAIATALYHRARTGEGQHVEVPMFETLTAFNLVEHLAGHAFEPPEGPIGYTRALSPERRPYRTRDGYIAVLPYSTRHWIAFFEAVGRPEMASDKRVTDPTERSRNVQDLYRMITTIMPERTSGDWIALLRAADVPCVIVTSLDELEADPHLTDVGFFQSFEHPSEGAMRTTDVPVHYSQTPGNALPRPAPGLGEHTREVLAQAGYDADEVRDLLAIGAAIALG